MATKELTKENDLNINLDINNKEEDVNLCQQLQTYKRNNLQETWRNVKIKTLKVIVKCYLKMNYFPTQSVEFLLLDDTTIMKDIIRNILKSIQKSEHHQYLTLVDWIRTFTVTYGNFSIADLDDSFHAQFYDVLMHGMDEDTDGSDVEEQFELELDVDVSDQSAVKQLRNGMITTVKYIDHLLDHSIHDEAMWDVLQYCPLNNAEWIACFESCVSMMHEYGINLLLEVNQRHSFVAQHDLFSTYLLAVNKMDSDQFRHNMTADKSHRIGMSIYTYVTKITENNENVARLSNRPLPIINDDSNYIDTTPAIGKYAPKRKLRQT